MNVAVFSSRDSARHLCGRALRIFLLLALLLPGLTALAATGTTTALSVTAGGVPVTTVANGTVVVLAATVTAGSAPASPGLVLFCDASAASCTDSRLLGTAQLNAAGVATLKLRSTIGTRRFKAVFAGTSSLTGSSSTEVDLVVTGSISTSTAVSTTHQTVNVTSPILLQGTVSATGITSVLSALTGPVVFTDTTHSTSIGSAPLGAVSTSQSFGLPYPYPPAYVWGNGAGPAVVADLNGDGLPDAASANANANTITVVLNKGTFSYQQATYPVSHPVGIAAGDFDGDGNTDLVATDGQTNTVSILLNTGTGTFQPAVTYPVGGSPANVVVGDFNRDGWADVAVTNTTDNTISILLGNGNGTFRTQVAYTTGTQVNSLTSGDFNGDGSPDLAVAHYQSGAATTIGVLMNNGDGTFQPQATYTTGFAPASIDVGDFNGDGVLDLAVSNLSSGGVSVFLGSGGGTFQSPANYSTAKNAGQLAVGDVNGDGTSDLVVATSDGSYTVSVLLGKGDGTFQAKTSYITLTAVAGPSALADFDGDGVLDLLGASTSGGSVAPGNLSASAVATINNFMAVGVSQIAVKGAYAGNPPYGASSGTAYLSAMPATTTTTVTADPSTSVVGQQVALTVTVTPGSVNGLSDFGPVSIVVNGKTLTGVGGLVGPNGVLVLQTTALPQGTDTIVANYAGNVNFLASSGQTMATVNPVGVTLTLTTNPYSALQGTQNLYLGAAIQYTGTAPTAQVTFMVDGDGPALTSCSPTYTAGQLGCGIAWPGTSYGVGPHTITVKFAGDANYPAQTSTSTLTINAPGPSMSITVPPTTGTAGAATTVLSYKIVYTGAVPPNGGAGVLVDGQNPINVACSAFYGTPAPQTLTCQWPYQTGSLAPGQHTVTAFVLADGNYPVTTANGTLNLQ